MCISLEKSQNDLDDQIFVERSCLKEYADKYCHNGGECVAVRTIDGFAPFCRCAPGWHGHQCQYYYNEEMFGSARVAPAVDSSAVGPLVTIILIAFVVVCGLLYLSKKFCKTRDPRDFICSECVTNVATMSQVQIYPFSRSPEHIRS